MTAISGVVGAGAAHAHVVLAPDAAPPAAYYAGAFRISHGCAGQATTALRVEIPAAIVSAKPQPKPGWTLAIEREPLPSPIRTEGGGIQTQRVKAITWTGALPDDEFDAFGIMLKLPSAGAAAGPVLRFPVVQTCGANSVRWLDVPGPGQAWHDVPHPAPVLTLTPAGAADPMARMDHH